MTGWRIGYACANDVIAKVMANYVSHSTGSPVAISQRAAAVAPVSYTHLNVLWNANPFLTALVCLGKGILAGLAAGLVYRAIAWGGKSHSSGRMLGGSIAAGIVSPVVNTGLFLLGLFFLFPTYLEAWATGEMCIRDSRYRGHHRRFHYRHSPGGLSGGGGAGDHRAQGVGKALPGGAQLVLPQFRPGTGHPGGHRLPL